MSTLSGPICAQTSSDQRAPPHLTLSAVGRVAPDESAQQTAHILGLDEQLDKLQAIREAGNASSDGTELRLALIESIEAATLDVDDVLSEISAERSELGDLRASLQARRDKTVNLFTTAALLTGSGVGSGVSATQFTFLGNRTQNVGDAIGIGSGLASTMFSLIAARKQKGPSSSVGAVPNMLAPLLGGEPELKTAYPPTVLAFLNVVPYGEDASRGSRLQQLKQAWVTSGRLTPPGSSKEQATLKTLTSSERPDVKVSIDDLSNRIAMLGDVQGRVSLMKRDLALLMRSYVGSTKH